MTAWLRPLCSFHFPRLLHDSVLASVVVIAFPLHAEGGVTLAVFVVVCCVSALFVVPRLIARLHDQRWFDLSSPTKVCAVVCVLVLRDCIV
jgi:hypothetical protein